MINFRSYAALFLLAAVAPVHAARIQSHPAVSSTVPSPHYRVAAEGHALITEQFKDIHYAHFSFDGSVTVEVTSNAPITSYQISPRSLAVDATADGDTLRFKLDHPSHLVVTINGGERLFVFADPIDSDAPVPGEPGVTSVLEFGVDPTGKRLETHRIQQAIDQVAAAAGTLYFPPGIYLTGTIALKSNLTLYLAGGAMLLGSPDRDHYPVDPGFVESDMKNDPKNWTNKGGRMTYSRLVLIDGASHVRIAGRGVIDGQGRLIRDQGKPANLLRIRNSSHVTVEGVILRDPAAWNTHVLHSDHVTFRGVKIVNDRSVKNTDGINPDSARDVLIERCFMYCSDDTIAIKSSGNSRLLRDVERITVRDCVLITKKSAMKLGTETFAEVQRDITFANNDIIEADRAMSLYCMDGARFENIRFIGNRIESTYPDREQQTILFQVRDRDGDHAGSIRHVLIADTIVDHASPNPSSMDGHSEAHSIRDVRFVNYSVGGRLCRNADEAGIVLRDFVQDVAFEVTSTKH